MSRRIENRNYAAEYFRMVNVASDDIKLILKTFGLDLPLKLYTRGDLLSLKSKISLF